MKNVKRIGAIVLIIILAGLYIATFILGIMGSEYLAGMLFLDVIIPVLCWGIALIARVLRHKGEELGRQEEKQDN